MITLELKVIDLREKAARVSDGDREVWLPTSQIKIGESRPGSSITTIEIPEWLAIDKGLV
jgi:hypothetical protein